VEKGVISSETFMMDVPSAFRIEHLVLENQKYFLSFFVATLAFLDPNLPSQFIPDPGSTGMLEISVPDPGPI
jgi:hypothetical protein